MPSTIEDVLHSVVSLPIPPEIIDSVRGSRSDSFSTFTESNSNGAGPLPQKQGLQRLPPSRHLSSRVDDIKELYESMMPAITVIEGLTDINQVYAQNTLLKAFQTKLADSRDWASKLVALVRTQGDKDAEADTETVEIKLTSAVRMIQQRLLAANEYHELKSGILPEIRLEISRLDSSLEQIRGVALQLSTAMASSEPLSPLSPDTSFTEFSPHIPLRTQEAGMATALLQESRNRLSVIQAGLEFLPLQLECYDMHAKATFPGSVSELRKAIAQLQQALDSSMATFKELDRRLTQAWWDNSLAKVSSAEKSDIDSRKLEKLLKYGLAIGKDVSDFDFTGSPTQKSQGSGPQTLVLPGLAAPRRLSAGSEHLARSPKLGKIKPLTSKRNDENVIPAHLSNGSPKLSSKQPDGPISRPFVSRLREPTKIRSNENGSLGQKVTARYDQPVARIMQPPLLPGQHGTRRVLTTLDTSSANRLAGPTGIRFKSSAEVSKFSKIPVPTHVDGRYTSLLQNCPTIPPPPAPLKPRWTQNSPVARQRRDRTIYL